MDLSGSRLAPVWILPDYFELLTQLGIRRIVVLSSTSVLPVALPKPIHADDVASACLQALSERKVANQAYNISGAETLSYDELIQRVFSALGMKPRCPRIPILLFRIGATCLKIQPRYREISVGMAERMNSDLTFSHADASRDFGFQSRTFQLHRTDVEG